MSSIASGKPAGMPESSADMKIGLHDSENTGFPNLALMKLSAWHKAHGDVVEWWTPMLQYDRVYSSKVFTFTPDNIHIYIRPWKP